ncbi:hypothetical protein GALMADRAFT_217583 [Galerina marginata CBS 339.88]|uniref:Uncharacterized protein n=1 Tax=Galerina marginata (strain CBS 339.88) TaxID=685588 RepID=A0A067S3E3_GALM3|nr:hypothetical protein GALMADRAFT_217583 [Galerina marginata CBS 339.88]
MRRVTRQSGASASPEPAGTATNTEPARGAARRRGRPPGSGRARRGLSRNTRLPVAQANEDNNGSADSSARDPAAEYLTQLAALLQEETGTQAENREIGNQYPRMDPSMNLVERDWIEPLPLEHNNAPEATSADANPASSDSPVPMPEAVSILQTSDEDVEMTSPHGAEYTSARTINVETAATSTLFLAVRDGDTTRHFAVSRDNLPTPLTVAHIWDVFKSRNGAPARFLASLAEDTYVALSRSLILLNGRFSPPPISLEEVGSVKNCLSASSPVVDVISVDLVSTAFKAHLALPADNPLYILYIYSGNSYPELPEAATTSAPSLAPSILAGPPGTILASRPGLTPAQGYLDQHFGRVRERLEGWKVLATGITEGKATAYLQVLTAREVNAIMVALSLTVGPRSQVSKVFEGMAATITLDDVVEFLNISSIHTLKTMRTLEKKARDVHSNLRSRNQPGSLLQPLDWKQRELLQELNIMLAEKVVLTEDNIRENLHDNDSKMIRNALTESKAKAMDRNYATAGYVDHDTEQDITM